MKNVKGEVIYVGRAGSLKKRVSSYFIKAHDAKTEALVSHVASIDCKKTDSVLEATFKEAELIKKHQPKYNIEQKDDKSFIYVVITKDIYPRVLVARGRELEKTPGLYQAVFGPFKSRDLVQSLLKLVRKIIPFSACKPPRDQKKIKPCFYNHLGLCPGVCTLAITPREYKKIIKNLILFFSGKRKRVIANLVREMERLSKEEDFESAARIRNQLHNLKHICDVALMKKEEISRIPFRRIEGYDVSNISGKYAVGSMVVFINGEPDKKEYRKFKIKTVEGINDTEMLKEILRRRFTHKEWSLPDLIFIDGGTAQVNAGVEIARSMNFFVPIVGIAKGKTRKKVELIFNKEAKIFKKEIMELRELFARVRDEAHRFALSYHKKLRKFAIKHS
ncbi:MAG: Excinuclease ABC C subunit domain protein [Parcubacteria group bacterium GW2011_GWC2_44_17]|nr:MAG: Excinuclease ABC C subunit domain protein [Parcubacteria group bacterium GW2011_GWC2_44_17]KKT50301.1 MAG: Excinuclease ABC C subunit domain protein [Parcubacteria group bacterium GW2011_GWF2_44_17]